MKQVAIEVHALAVAVAAMIGCSNDSGAPRDPAFARGEKVYRNICTTCHNSDPSQDGVLGPAIAGASRDLLEAKVLRGVYPPGYEPKRTTGQMPELAYLEPHIADLAVFLGAAADGSANPAER